MYRHEDVPDGPMYKKFWKLWPCPQMCCKCNLACRCCRKLVSRSKVRYQKDSFDLDLVYASPDNRIITHGFPAAGIEHFFRNPRCEMVRFLDRYHKNHYKVYNLCCEPGRGYAPEVFHGMSLMVDGSMRRRNDPHPLFATPAIMHIHTSHFSILPSSIYRVTHLSIFDFGRYLRPNKCNYVFEDHDWFCYLGARV